MKQVVEIVIRADVPEDNVELGHEGVVQTRPGVAAVVDTLTELGLLNVQATRRLAAKKAPNATAKLPALVPFKPAA